MHRLGARERGCERGREREGKRGKVKAEETKRLYEDPPPPVPSNQAVVTSYHKINYYGVCRTDQANFFFRETGNFIPQRLHKAGGRLPGRLQTVASL